jgi:hypothetical protein
LDLARATAHLANVPATCLATLELATVQVATRSVSAGATGATIRASVIPIGGDVSVVEALFCNRRRGGVSLLPVGTRVRKTRSNVEGQPSDSGLIHDLGTCVEIGSE